MKKIALILASTSSIATAFAGDLPEVKINGRIDSMMGFTHQEDDFRYVRPGNNTSGKYATRALVNDTRLDFNIKFEKEDFIYGGFIALHADTSKSTSGESGIGDKTYVYVQNNKIGRLELGNNLGAGGVIEMTGTNYAVGAYGVDGFSNFWVNNNTYLRPFIDGGAYNVFIVSPNLPSNVSGNHYADAPKITFYSKPIENLTVGLSYIPDLDSTGTVAGRANKNGGAVDEGRQNKPATLRNIFSGGIQYKYDINDDLQIKTGIAGEVGQAKKSVTGQKLLRDLRAYEATLALTYKGYTAYGSYGDWGKTGTFREAFAGTKQGASYWTLGLAKSWDKISSSLTYMSSKKAGGLELLANSMGARSDTFVIANTPLTDKGFNKYQNVVLDVEYKIAEGFAAYTEYGYFKFKEFGAAKNNKGSTVLLGSRIIF